MERPAYLWAAWAAALRIWAKMLPNSSRFRFARMCVPKRRFRNFRARLSLDTFNNSMVRLSYGACPTTSRTKSRMNFVCLVWIYKDKNKVVSGKLDQIKKFSWKLLQVCNQRQLVTMEKVEHLKTSRDDKRILKSLVVPQSPLTLVSENGLVEFSSFEKLHFVVRRFKSMIATLEGTFI